MREIIINTLKSFIRPIFRFLVWVSLRLIEGFIFALRIALPKDKFYRSMGTICLKSSTVATFQGIRFHVTHPKSYLRAREFMVSEPNMVAWINDFVDENSVFYDVGANIGVYSLYAAAKRGAKVIAFEPFSPNYDLINTNIQLNGLDDRVIAFNLALHNEDKVSLLNVSKLYPGSSIHTIEVTKGGSLYDEFKPIFKQGMMAMRLDTFVNKFDQPFPTHVKIDVDGNDPLVLEGMEGILSDSKLKGVAIEVNPKFRETDRGVLEVLEKYGFQRLTEEVYNSEPAVAAGRAFNWFFIRK